MFGVINLWTYVLGVIFIVLLPGPNSLYVLSVAAQRGVRAGYRGALGVFLGDTVLMVLAAAGAASLLETNLTLYHLVQAAGALYLGWLGINMLRAAWMRWRTRVAVSCLSCQIGCNTASTSSVVTSDTGLLPKWGRA